MGGDEEKIMKNKEKQSLEIIMKFMPTKNCVIC